MALSRVTILYYDDITYVIRKNNSNNTIWYQNKIDVFVTWPAEGETPFVYIPGMLVKKE